MNMAQKKLYLLLVCTMLCIFQIQFAFGQEKFVINGNLKDQLTGEVIIRAVVRIEELPNLGVLSNEYGFYAIALPKGKYTLLITQLGYEKYKQQVTLEENISINIFLKPAWIGLVPLPRILSDAAWVWGFLSAWPLSSR